MALKTTMYVPRLALLIAAAVLSGCGGDREAEADTPVSEAEVSTELPESVVSDNQLQASANAAAQVAATPPPEVVFVPVPTGQPGQAKAPAQGKAAPQTPGAGAGQQKNSQ